MYPGVSKYYMVEFIVIRDVGEIKIISSFLELGIKLMFKNPIRGHCFMSSGRVDSQSESVLPLSVIVFYSFWFFWSIWVVCHGVLIIFIFVQSSVSHYVRGYWYSWLHWI